MFGPELMEAFREFKALWDPDNRMNPGKLVDAVRVYDPVENLRHGPAATPAETHATRSWKRILCLPPMADRWKARRSGAWAWEHAARPRAA